jgi:hypothetical protein
MRSVIWLVWQVAEVVVGISIAEISLRVRGLSLFDGVEVIDEAFAGLPRKH